MILYTRKASAATWKVCRLTPGSSSVKWTSRMLIRSMACRRPFRSTRRRRRTTRARRSGRSLKSMTSYGCCGPGSAPPSARTITFRFPVNPRNRWSTGSWNCPNEASCKFWPRWCAIRRGPKRRSLNRSKKTVSSGSKSMVRPTTLKKRPNWIKTSSTKSTSSSIGSWSRTGFVRACLIPWKRPCG